MKILALLQNQWFQDPATVQKIFERRPEKRNDLIRRFLFMGGLSGKRLQQAFGEELCHKIIWEEATLRIGDHSGSNFGFDAEHIQKAILEHEPDLVVAFGKIAGDGLLAAQRLISASDHRCEFDGGVRAASCFA